MFPEPHSTKQVEDAVAFGLDGPVEVLLMDDDEPVATMQAEVEAICRRVRCPVLVVHGDRDNCQPFERGLALAELVGAELVALRGAGHIPNARHPVVVNRLIREFAARVGGATPPRVGPRSGAAEAGALPLVADRARARVARRGDARELRRLVPRLEVHRLAQHPVTTLLAHCGETVHPASRELAAEAAGVDAEAGEHELQAFHMLRGLDEIFCANFMVFHDLVEEEPFDLWIADEAWEVDYFRHESPELKRAPYACLSDFVGVVPIRDGGEREAFLAADASTC